MHIKITVVADELKIFVQGLPVEDGVFEANYEDLGAIIQALVAAQTNLTHEMLKLAHAEARGLDNTDELRAYQMPNIRQADEDEDDNVH